MHCNKPGATRAVAAAVRLCYGSAPRPRPGHQGKNMEPTSTGTILGLTAGVLVMFLLACAVGGLITGALARLVLPGPDPMSWLATLGYGVGGSVLGGIVGMILHLPNQFGWILSIACAAGLIWYFRRRKSSAAASAPPPPPPAA